MNKTTYRVGLVFEQGRFYIIDSCPLILEGNSIGKLVYDSSQRTFDNIDRANRIMQIASNVPFDGVGSYVNCINTSNHKISKILIRDLRVVISVESEHRLDYDCIPYFHEKDVISKCINHITNVLKITFDYKEVNNFCNENKSLLCLNPNGKHPFKILLVYYLHKIKHGNSIKLLISINEHFIDISEILEPKQ